MNTYLRNHVFRLNIFRVIITVSIIICFVFFGFIQAKDVRVDYAYQQIRYQCINVLNGFYVENKVICRCTRSIYNNSNNNNIRYTIQYTQTAYVSTL